MYQGSCSGVIARKVLIRMALLQRETLTDIKNRTLNCLKWHFSTAGRSIKTTAMLIEDGGICPLFRPHRGAFGQAQLILLNNPLDLVSGIIQQYSANAC